MKTHLTASAVFLLGILASSNSMAAPQLPPTFEQKVACYEAGVAKCQAAAAASTAAGDPIGVVNDAFHACEDKVIKDCKITDADMSKMQEIERKKAGLDDPLP